MMKFLRYTLAIVLAIFANLSMEAAEPYKVLTFPDDNQTNNKCSNYIDTWEAKIGSYSWTIKGFSNHSWADGCNYITCGQKGQATTATIASSEPNGVGTIVVTIDKVDTSVNPKLAVKFITSAGSGTRKQDITKPGNYQLKGSSSVNAVEVGIVTDVASVDDAVQISKIAYYNVGEEPDDRYLQAESLEDLFDKCTKTTDYVEVNFTNAKVLYGAVISGTRTAYVREGNRAIKMTNFAKGTIKINGILNGKMKFKKFYASNGGSLDADGAACEILTESEDQAQPREATIDEIRNGGKFKNDLVVVKDFVASIAAGRPPFAYDAYQNRIFVYGDYGVNDLSELTDGETYSAEGIVNGNSGNDPILHITKKVMETTTGISDITINEVTKDAPAYNLAGQKVSKDYKGVVIKAGKKMIQ